MFPTVWCRSKIEWHLVKGVHRGFYASELLEVPRFVINHYEQESSESPGLPRRATRVGATRGNGCYKRIIPREPKVKRGYLIEIINPDLVGVLVGINFFVPGVAVGRFAPSANPGLSEP